VAASNELTCLGLSCSCDFHKNMGQMFISSSAGALHVKVASMVAMTASTHGCNPSAVTTCRIEIGRALEESPKTTRQLLRLVAVSPPVFAACSTCAAVTTTKTSKRNRAACIVHVSRLGAAVWATRSKLLASLAQLFAIAASAVAALPHMQMPPGPSSCQARSSTKKEHNFCSNYTNVTFWGPPPHGTSFASCRLGSTAACALFNEAIRHSFTKCVVMDEPALNIAAAAAAAAAAAGAVMFHLRLSPLRLLLALIDVVCFFIAFVSICIHALIFSLFFSWSWRSQQIPPVSAFFARLEGRNWSGASVLHPDGSICPTPRASCIQGLSATKIARRIKSGGCTSSEAVAATIAAIKAVDPLIRAVVADRFDAAAAEAAECDRCLRGCFDKQNLPPFYGVPLTVKECFSVAGLPNTSHTPCRTETVAECDATLVKRLRAAGFIIVAVTSTSELCMWLETRGPLRPPTCNPYNLARHVGGSSGGEGAIISSGASVCGIGSDIGGSIRLPAHFCGIWGHKPSAGLVPNSGQFPCDVRPPTAGWSSKSSALVVHGPQGAMNCSGPMCAHCEDLFPLLRLMVGPDGDNGWCDGHTSLPPPSSCNVAPSDVTVYVVESPRVTLCRRPHADALSAVHRAASALSALGCDVQQVPLPQLLPMGQAWVASMHQNHENGNPSFSELMAGHGSVPTGVAPRTLLPGWELLRWAFGFGQYSFPAIILSVFERLPSIMPRNLQQAQLDHAVAFRQRLHDLLAPSLRVSPLLTASSRRSYAVLLMPTFPRAAEPHFQPMLSPFDFGFTGAFNAAGCPVTQVPMGLGCERLPIGIQVISAHGCDHVTLAVASMLAGSTISGAGWVAPK
jgi:fatty acid amide hydrolase 2